MKYLKLSLIFLTSIVLSCNSKSDNYKNANIDKWYEGGTLHKLTGVEWVEATEENKLATCADFVMTIAEKNGEKPLVFSKQFRTTSESLKNCIDKFYELEGSQNTPVSKAAIECIK